MTTTAMEAPASARDALLVYLSTANGPVSPSELAAMTGVEEGTVRVTLHRMAKDGQAVAATRGRWTLAKSPTELAVPEPAVVAYTRPIRHRGPDIDGAKVLDGVTMFNGHFVRVPRPSWLDVITLWAAHTHLRDEDGRLCTDASPRLLLLSNEPGSGKSTVLELLNLLCPRTDGLIIEPTEAAFRSMMSVERLTMLLDEADVLFGSGKRKEAIRAMVNASYTRNGTVRYMDRRQVVKANVFGPVAIAGLDKLEKGTGGLLAAILSRSIILRMEKAKDVAGVPDITSSAVGQEAGRQGRKLLSLWASNYRDVILAQEPEMPEGVTNRDAQIWRPLGQVAYAAGGDWPERWARACAELAKATPAAPKDETDEMTAGFFGALAKLDRGDEGSYQANREHYVQTGDPESLELMTEYVEEPADA
jgi:energy-coupling factor transporter ATP-binding protein EcfA2